jgi:signal transduction histidine kinase
MITPLIDRDTLALLAGLAHELRGPLGAISGHAELLEMGVHGPVNPAQIDGLRRIHRNQEAMLHLLQQLMAWAEVAAGELPHDPQPTPLSEIIRGAVASCGAYMTERRCTLELIGDPCDGAGPLLTVDGSLATAAMTALLHDAIDHAAGPVIRVIVDNGPPLSILVDTDGPPLASDGAEFVPFHRNGRGFRKPHVRYPLALPQARALARAQGGEVHIVSTSHAQHRVVRLELPDVTSGHAYA